MNVELGLGVSKETAARAARIKSAVRGAEHSFLT